jgi:hypothetical protein
MFGISFGIHGNGSDLLFTLLFLYLIADYGLLVFAADSADCQAKGRLCCVAGSVENFF